MTAAGYRAVTVGMTYEAVVRILGPDGTELSSDNIAGTRTAMYQWDGNVGGNMT